MLSTMGRLISIHPPTLSIVKHQTIWLIELLIQLGVVLENFEEKHKLNGYEGEEKKNGW